MGLNPQIWAKTLALKGNRNISSIYLGKFHSIIDIGHAN